MQTGVATVENSMQFPQKTENGTAFWPGNSTAGIIPWEPWHTNPKEPLHPNVHRSTIYNSQVLKATQVPISKWMDQKTMAHLHNGILCTRKKAGASTLCDFMDGTGEHYGKWKKPGSERQIPYDLTFYWHLINKTNMEAKYDIEIGNNLAVTRGKGGGR